MGNWRTVDIKGTIDINDVEDIRAFLSPDNYKDNENAYPFTMGHSICGLGKWVNLDGSINISGNLYEKDLSIKDIERGLEVLAKRYKSLNIVLHTGSDYESTVCTATFHVKDGVVTKCAPEVDNIRDCIVRTLEEYFAEDD